MRVKVLLLLFFVGVLGTPATSHAEKVRTNAKAKVYNRPGEQGKIIVRVKEGQAMTVLSKEGRWLKVRVSGRTGFIPRSYVDMPNDDDEIPRNSRRRAFVDGRSTKRSPGGDAPDDRIGADATEDRGGGDDEGDEPSGDEGDSGDDEPEKKPKKSKKPERASKGGDDEEEEGDSEDDEPVKEEEEEEEKDTRKRARVSEKTPAYSEADKKSDKAFTASPKDELFVERTKGKWTEVSIEEGDIGWVLTSKLEMDGDDDGDEGGGRRKGRIIDTRARLGFRLISQTLSSAGGAMVWPDRYKIGSSSVAVSLGGALLFPYKKDFLVGGALDYDLAYAIPGISFDPDGANGPMAGSTTSFVMHNVRVRAVGGYDFHKKNGLVVMAKLGVHYESFLVANKEDLTKNTARLPSEVIKGPGLGLAIAVPRITDKVGIGVNLDAVIFGGSLTQTKNLEDGANPSVTRYTVSAIVNYKYSNGFDLNFGYDLNYASLTFGAPIATSMRMHTGTAVARKDLNHTVSAGISKAF